MPFDISNESYEKGYTKVFDGVYLLSEPHKPNLLSWMLTINNRGFVFEADNKKNGKHLLMCGTPGPDCIPFVQAVEKETGLTLKKVVGSGDFHHMSMKNWVSQEAFRLTKI